LNHHDYVVKSNLIRKFDKEILKNDKVIANVFVTDGRMDEQTEQSISSPFLQKSNTNNLMGCSCIIVLFLFVLSTTKQETKITNKYNIIYTRNNTFQVIEERLHVGLENIEWLLFVNRIPFLLPVISYHINN